MSTISAFGLGTLYLSARIHRASAERYLFHRFVMQCLQRHSSCDWGEIDPEDVAFNQLALSSGSRLCSCYDVPADLGSSHSRVWIITEHDRSATTILLPEEY